MHKIELTKNTWDAYSVKVDGKTVQLPGHGLYLDREMVLMAVLRQMGIEVETTYLSDNPNQEPVVRSNIRDGTSA